MITHPAYPVDPWCLRETTLHTDLLAQSESLFALANGHIGLRGNLDEGEPYGTPGSYLNGFYELRPLPYAEAGFGNPESGQSMINVTNGKLLRLLVDDEPFDVRYGELLEHVRTLDFRAGTLRRRAVWETPGARRVRIDSVRLVSLTQRAVAAFRYDVTALEAGLRVVVQSELVANETVPGESKDPRSGAALTGVLVGEVHEAAGRQALLVHRTQRSGLRLAAAMDHEVEFDGDIALESASDPDLGRVTVAANLAAGQRLRVIKFVAYGWSAERSPSALRDQAAAALTAARQTSWSGLAAEQRAYLDEFWEGADVAVQGDPETQQAVRFALFHLLQGAARLEGRAIPAKGLTGPGYDGHCFWDSEAYVLPVLTYTAAGSADQALRWRHSTLPLAKRRAEQLGHTGAAFPWRTINGAECSGYWPAGTAGVHIAADIADAVVRYLEATGDDRFEREAGLELLVETARFWRSLGHYHHNGTFRIDGVTGPDEYSALADNNVYTNLMAQRNLRAAAEAAERHPRHAAGLGADPEEAAGWRQAADAMCVPWDDALGIHPQAEGFTSHQLWDFEATGPEQYPLLLHFPYFDLYRKQVVKQADLVFAMHRRPDAFTPEQKARNFAYYEGITVRDSSLSASIQSVMAAEVGHLDLAHAYLVEAALLDLDDLEHNTRDGLHLAALAGAWLALVDGFAGMRTVGARLSFAPRLPARLTGLAFTITWRGQHLHLEITGQATTYTLANGAPLTVVHHGEEVALRRDAPETLANPPAAAGEAPVQPPGRAPGVRLGATRRAPRRAPSRPGPTGRS